MKIELNDASELVHVINDHWENGLLFEIEWNKSLSEKTYISSLMFSSIFVIPFTFRWYENISIGRNVEF